MSTIGNGRTLPMTVWLRDGKDTRFPLDGSKVHTHLIPYTVREWRPQYSRVDAITGWTHSMSVCPFAFANFAKGRGQFFGRTAKTGQAIGNQSERTIGQRSGKILASFAVIELKQLDPTGDCHRDGDQLQIFRNAGFRISRKRTQRKLR